MTETTDAPPRPRYRLDDGVAVITLDDGKVNALDLDVIDTVHGYLDRAADEADAVVLAGRDGTFSAGFNLKIMTESLDAMRTLVTAGAELLVRIYGFDLPTVTASSGHALAAGVLILLAADHRVGAADVPSKIGLNEVAIGMPLPIFAIELARERLTSPRAFNEATLQARLYDPAEAVEAGYLDRIVPASELLNEAVADARRLGALRRGAYAGTKRNARADVIKHITDTLEADMHRATGPQD